MGWQSELYSLFFGQISGTDSGVAVRAVQSVLWADQRDIVGQQSELYSLFLGQISGADSGTAVRAVQSVLWADQWDR